MMHLSRICFHFYIAMAMFFATTVLADDNQILHNIDKNTNRLDTDISLVATMIRENVEDGTDKRIVRMFRRDYEDKFLMLFQEPSYKTGQGYLRVEDVLWYYDPQSRKFSIRSMKDRFDNSNARNSDFRRSALYEDYDVVSKEEGKLGKYPVYILQLQAKHDEVTYPKQILHVLQKPNLILKAQNYSVSDQLMRTSYWPGYTKSGGIYIATKRIFVDEVIKGNKTTFSFNKVSTTKLAESTFTKAYVERVNR
jgi:outer membrane lipoprotein-sorting protein